jgi:predicted Zn-dependent protease with MMP-like domain
LVEVTPERFAELVADALDGIPEELGRLMDNVNVFVDDHSPPGRLFGLYEGIPLTHRDQYGGMVMPDKITIFRRTICAACRSEAQVTRQVQVTVIHEVAHHFGISDARLDELGWG